MGENGINSKSLFLSLSIRLITAFVLDPNVLGENNGLLELAGQKTLYGVAKISLFLAGKPDSNLKNQVLTLEQMVEVVRARETVLTSQ